MIEEELELITDETARDTLNAVGRTETNSKVFGATSADAYLVVYDTMQVIMDMYTGFELRQASRHAGEAFADALAEIAIAALTRMEEP